jgi:hypothetical protein
MCGSSNAPPPPPPPPPAPPVLEQIAPKSADSGKESKTKKKAKGLSRYKYDDKGSSSSSSLGGIPKKTGV